MWVNVKFRLSQIPPFAKALVDFKQAYFKMFFRRKLNG